MMWSNGLECLKNTIIRSNIILVAFSGADGTAGGPGGVGGAAGGVGRAAGGVGGSSGVPGV